MSVQDGRQAGCSNADHLRFTGVMFATNGCIACECEKLQSENKQLRASLRSVEDQLIEVATAVGAKCGEGVPAGGGDTLSAAILRKWSKLIG